MRFQTTTQERLAARPDAAAHPAAVLVVGVEGLDATRAASGRTLAEELVRIVRSRVAGAVGGAGATMPLPGGDVAVSLPWAAADVALAVGDAIVEATGAPLELGGVVLRPRVGVGLATGGGTLPFAELMRRADVARHEARSGYGGSRVAVFDVSSHAAVLEGLALAHELPGAIARGELTLHYQPIVDLVSRVVVGREALVRWEHPDRGLVPPDAFIPLAERDGLMDELGAWVLDEACRTACTWPEADGVVPYVSVNLAVQQLTAPGFAGSVLRTLEDAGLSASQLVLEVTESVVAEVEAVGPALVALRAAGARTYLDDFGTGYSSLGAIRELPLDGVKLDRAFIADIVGSAEGLAVAAAIVRMLRGLGLATTVEGVETAAQLAQLRALGCRSAQGFYFGRPAPVPPAAVATPTA